MSVCVVHVCVFVVVVIMFSRLHVARIFYV